MQIGAAELGLGLDEPDRPLTVTGGLTFAGGPGNNYATHSIAAMVDVLRRDRRAIGLVSALGWYVTKHAIGLYSTAAPPKPFAVARPQDDVDALPRRELVSDVDEATAVTVESYTVMHERDGSPALGIVATLLPDGRRAWGNVRDALAMKAMTVEDVCGRPASLHPDGAVDIG